jgi:hypothetical protein
MTMNWPEAACWIILILAIMLVRIVRYNTIAKVKGELDMEREFVASKPVSDE